MQDNTDMSFLHFDKLRNRRIKKAKNLNKIRLKALKLTAMSLIVGICISTVFYPHIKAVFASTPETPAVAEDPALPEPSIDSAKEVKVEVVIKWTPKRIEQEIRATFPETPNTAVAIATEEGGLLKERQSDYYKNGVRERSFCTFQIHEPSWGIEAKRLGYGEYKTNPTHCIAMARHIYDSAEQSWGDWSAYTNGAYKKHLK